MSANTLNHPPTDLGYASYSHLDPLLQKYNSYMIGSDWDLPWEHPIMANLCQYHSDGIVFRFNNKSEIVTAWYQYFFLFSLNENKRYFFSQSVCRVDLTNDETNHCICNPNDSCQL